MKKNFFKNNGYTLIEVSVVIAMIGILSSIVMVGLQSGRAEEQVKAAQNELASAVKLAQSFALQGRMQSGAVPKRYGVEKNGGGYRIYYCQAEDCIASGGKQTAEQYDFESGVSVSIFDFRFDVPHGNVKMGEETRATLGKEGFSRWIELGKGGTIERQ